MGEGQIHSKQIDGSGAVLDDVLAWDGSAWVPISPSGGMVEQHDLLDNDSTYIVVGNKTTDKVVEVEYSFQLTISGRQRNGLLTISHDGTTATIDEDYYYEDGDEILSVTFGATIVGDEIRLSIVTVAVGENPKMVYRRFKLGLAA